MIKMLIICLMGGSSLSATALENGFEINASYDANSKSVVIKWKNNDQCASQFILQKSDDQQTWTNVDTLYNTETFNEQMILWEDRNPVPGGFLYRLKTVVDDYNYSFSKPVYVKISPWIYDWSIAEGNKKDKLQLKYTGSGEIEGVINLSMQTRSGKVLFKSRYSSFTTDIDIPTANLGRGNYYITMFVEGELIWKYKLVK